MSTYRSKALKDYKAGYNRSKAIKHFKKTGSFKNRKDGSGHKAGEIWAERKEIDPTSRIQRYSKNSPSFDEGVYKYKQSVKSRVLHKMDIAD